MTLEEFNARYKLLKQIDQGEGRSYTAQEVPSGRAVLAHFLGDDQLPPGVQFRDLMDQLPSRDRSRVLEILSVESSTVVITQFLEDFEGFDAWVRSRLADHRPSVAPPAPAPPGGDFTGLFEQGSSPEPQVPPASLRPARDSFTDLFKTPPEPMSQLRPLSTPAMPPVEVLRVRLPASDPAPAPAPVPPPTPASALPKPSWPRSFDPPEAAPPLPPLPRPMLGSQAPPVPAAPIIRPPALGSAPPPAPLPAWSGESDYTRQLSRAPAPIEAAPPLPSAPPLDPGGSKPAPGGTSQSIVPLLLVLNLVVIIATGVILYFALKKH